MEITEERVEERIRTLEKRLETVENNQPEDKLSKIHMAGMIKYQACVLSSFYHYGI